MVKYSIVEFEDGLQVVPTVWLMNGDTRCIWPDHHKNQLYLNRAIIRQEMPKPCMEWPVLEVKRKFGTAVSYEQAVEKLMLAEDTSNIDDSFESQDNEELSIKRKQKRRLQAKRKLSSDEEEDEDELPKQSILPPFPTPPIVSAARAYKKTPMSLSRASPITSDGLLRETLSSTPQLFSMNNWESTSDILSRTQMNASPVLNKDSQEMKDFQKEVLRKLNTIHMEIRMLSNRFDAYEESMAALRGTSDKNFDQNFPLINIEVLERFDKEVENHESFNRAVRAAMCVGGSDVRNTVNGILKKFFIDELAENFSVFGRKGKLSFRSLTICNVIIQAVRSRYSSATDDEILKQIGLWLAQSKTRRQRKENGTTEGTYEQFI